ncbi:MAG: hypothetical protein NTY88_06735 [Bacteroidetes bacterium]|nr:hypothetical protein [Bacteroidota bacterium]
MKSKFLFLLPVFFVLVMSSCKKDKCEQTITYKKYEPVYMSFEELRASVKSEPAQALKKPGKIYIKGNYIFVNEIDKGIHIIDNTNPSSPQNIAFINIPGNMDIAATGNTLYADSYMDLVALDISNPLSVTVQKRIQDALPQRVYTYGYTADATKGVVLEWAEKMVTEKLSADCNTGQVYYNRGMEGDVMFAGTAGTVSPTTSVQTPGIGGSTARFTIASNALYIVDNSNLHVYDISNSSDPQKVSDKNIGWSIETIFPYQNHLFIGSSSGVYIYDNSNPLSPNYISVYNHITACDPVTVEGNYMYFTLSNDAPCHMGVNQLEVVDITDLANPTMKTTVPMTNPKGLGIDNKTLFICDSNDGLKVYDATDVLDIANHQIAHFSNINSHDVIPFNNILLMIGNDGLYQYDYSNVQNISLLSRIPVEN